MDFVSICTPTTTCNVSKVAEQVPLVLVNGVKICCKKLLGLQSKVALLLLVQLHPCMSAVAAVAIVTPGGESWNCVREIKQAQSFPVHANSRSSPVAPAVNSCGCSFFSFLSLSLSSEAHTGFPPSLFFRSSTCENKLHHAA